MDDDRTVLEGLDADHVRLLAESAELKDAMRRVVNELRKTAELDVQTSLADKLSELGRTLAATERERGAVLQRINEELGERMDDSFEGQHPTVPAAAGMDGSFSKQPYSHLQAARVAEKRDRDDDCDFDLDCSDGDSSPAGSSEDDSGSAAVQCLGQPQEHEACSEQAMTADTSERLKPTHPQPTEVSECLCPASHRREYYSDDFAGGGGC